MSSIGTTKTFGVTQWGTLERKASAKNEKPVGLGIKDEKRQGRHEVKVVYSRRVSKSLKEQQRKMLDRKLSHKKSSTHEAFNSVCLLDYLDPSERHVGANADLSHNSVSIGDYTSKFFKPFPHH